MIENPSLAIPLIPVPRPFSVGLRYVANIWGDLQQLPQDRCGIYATVARVVVRL
jgi:hypothetical protein